MWLRKRVLKWLSKDVHAVPTATRAIGDIKIVVERGIAGSRNVQVQAWEPGMAQELFWSIWDGVSEREGK